MYWNYLKLLLFPIFVVIFSYLLVRIWNFFVCRHYVNKLPGPRSYYVLGNTLDLIGSSEKTFKMLRPLSSQYRTYRMWALSEPLINLTLPEDIEKVISTTENLTKSPVYDALKDFLGDGLLISDGSKWHTRRKILTPAFHFNILQQFIGAFVRHATDLTEQLESHVDAAFVDVLSLVTTFTLGSICETAMGFRLDPNSKEQISYKNAITRVNQNVQEALVRPIHYYFFTKICTPLYWQQMFVIRKLHAFTNRVIQERRTSFSAASNEETEIDDFTTKKRMAMLDLLFFAKEKTGIIDNEGIREEVDTFMFEGHDTTSMSLCFTFMLLANHKDVQDKVYQEIMDVFGHENRDPTYNDLQNLRYLELCLKESLRLYPSVPLISRLSTADINLPSGYYIPKGVTIILHIYDLHRNPDIYPDPERFDPDRFLPENSASRHPFAYLPFSGGPRNCIGQKFAILELKTVISAVLRKFILEPVDTPETIRVGQEIVLRPKSGVKVKLSRRL